MSASEIKNYLKDATGVHFLSNRFILLFFSRGYEADRAYEAVKGFFGDKPIALIFTIAGAELRLVMVDSSEQHVEIKGLAYDLSNLSCNLLDADKEYSIDLYLVHGHYLAESILPALGIGSILTQQQQKLDILNYRVLR